MNKIRPNTVTKKTAINKTIARALKTNGSHTSASLTKTFVAHWGLFFLNGKTELLCNIRRKVHPTTVREDLEWE